jgi:Tol biopolymer transport system component
MLLGACKTSLIDNTLPTINLTDVNSTAQSAAATLLAETMAPTLTATITLTNTRTPTNTPRPTPTPSWTPLPFTALPGLRAVYGEGNLYFQDSGKPEFQLTHSGSDYDPILSDDGQKVVFEHGMEIHAVNADGTGEHALITADILAALGHGYNKFTRRNDLAFVPGTHQLLFSTSRANPDNPNERATPNYDLFVVDTDAGGIKQLVAPGQVDNLYIHYGWEGKFAVSPNGNLIALQMPDHIQVINIQGQVVQQALVTYPADEAHSVIPMYWTKDSSELIILPSEIPLMSAEPIVRTVWRYKMDGSAGIKIPLTPPPLYDEYAVSPDGNWIVYSYSPRSIPDDMPLMAPVGVYLGNLHDGTSQLIDGIKLQLATSSSSFNWSPDSLHFICSAHDLTDYAKTYIGNIDGEVTLLGGGALPSWIDNNHFLYGGGHMGQVGIIDRVLVLDLFPPGFQNDDVEPPVFVYLGN